MQDKHEIFMQRCLQLAKLGTGNVAPNPMVGAVLVYSNRIIGEGYHRKYGEAHAEVNCISSVLPDDIHLISQSTLYVSLEPCVHFGKTPPCTDLILHHKIARVVIGCKDSFTKVNGKGIEKLQQNGADVTVGILEKECIDLNKQFFIFHHQNRPYIILKWAQSYDTKIANKSDKRMLISNELTNKLVHKWRTEESGILIGNNTMKLDNPELTNRFRFENKPIIRLIINLDHFSYNLYYVKYRNLKVFNHAAPTIVFNLSKNSEEFDQPLKKQTYFRQIQNRETVLPEILSACYELNIQSLIVEGGAKTLQSFIDAGIWDEARIITNIKMNIGDGLSAPVINGQLVSQYFLGNDSISFFTNKPK